MDPLLSRHVTPSLTQMLDHFPAVELVGARQVGKTTLARLLGHARPGGAHVLSLDEP